MRLVSLVIHLGLVQAFVVHQSTSGRVPRGQLAALSDEEDAEQLSSSATTHPQVDRRGWLQRASAATALFTGLSIPPWANAIDVSSISKASSTPALSKTTAAAYIDPDDAKITDKVFFDVRISRQDGTFYVRDDLPDTPENRVFRGRLTMGLFGEAAPNHVQRFKSYFNPAVSDEDDNPLPNYSRSVFSSIDQATGLLTGGRIPALEVTLVNGSPALRYGGRLLSSALWTDASSGRITHRGRGLLTHRRLEPLPVFGVTTRADTTVLDNTHTVFGRLLDDDDARRFLDVVRDLPTYAAERPVDTDNRVDADPSLMEESTRAVYAAQRNFFRNAARVLGDTRLDKAYEGKLLRRVEVTRVGYL